MSEGFHQFIPQELHAPGHTAAGLTVLAAIWGQLPTILGVIGGLLGVVWYSILIWEWWDRRRKAKASVEPQ